MAKPTDRELEILRHSLGVGDDGRGREYRNGFAAGAKDESACRSLVAKGLMVESGHTGSFPVFAVTDEGRDVAVQRTQPSDEDAK